MTVADSVARRALYRQGTPIRVAARHIAAQGKTAREDVYKHKLVGKDARILWGDTRGWSRPAYLIEELPQKGKKKLGRWQLVTDLSLFLRWMGMNSIYFNGDEMVKKAGIGSGDNFQSMVKKMEAAFEKEAQELIKDIKSGKTDATRDPAEVEKSWQNMLGHPRTDQVFYLNVMPEGVGSFSVQGKDFTMDVEWTNFKVYSPDSDFHQADPYYTYYEASSPAAARKLYKILAADKEALRSVAWTTLSNWLDKNKVAYKSHSSSW